MKNPTGAGARVPGQTRGARCGRWGRTLLLFAALGFAAPLAGQQAGSSEEFLDRLEWRGVMALPGDVRISLHDKGGEGGFWVGIGEIRSGVEVVEYDPGQGRVTLRHGEATRTLTMSSSSVAVLAEQTPPAPRIGEAPAVPAAPQLDDQTRERLARLWQQAREDSFDLQEIDYAFQALNRERLELAESIAGSPPGNPDLAPLLERQNELRAEEQRLTEGALAELQRVGNLPADVAQELNAGLRAGLLAQLPPPPQEQDGLEESGSAPAEPVAESPQ